MRDLPLPVCITLCIALLVLSACGTEAPSAGEAAARVDPAVVIAPKDLATTIRTEPVAEQSVAETLRVPGTVALDEYRVARIGSQVTGRITRLVAKLGQFVRPGEILTVVHSTDLGSAQLAYLKASAQVEISEKAVQRAKELFAADVIGRAELQKRETEHKVARAELRSAHTQLILLGMNEQEVGELARTGEARASAAVRATIAGTVVERKITQGQVVQATDLLYTIADLNEMWVVAEVPEQQSDGLRVGQTVQIEIPALAAVFESPLVLVDTTVDPETRTVLVRAQLKNDNGRLKPNMLATMIISAQPKRGLALPESAVVMESGREHVFVEEAPGHYRIKPVRLGKLHMGLRPVLDGVTPGERVVLEGGFHLNNERKRAELGS
jgi:cobalt-zinc-cadmium efflux system membrane fusion protein